MSLAHAGVSCHQTCQKSVRTRVPVQLLHRQQRVTDCLRGRTDDGSSGRGQYLVCLESSDVSNIAADLAALGFQSALNPGRMIRVLHTLVRTLLITLRVSTHVGSKSSAQAKPSRQYKI